VPSARKDLINYFAGIIDNYRDSALNSIIRTFLDAKLGARSSMVCQEANYPNISLRK